MPDYTAVELSASASEYTVVEMTGAMRRLDRDATVEALRPLDKSFDIKGEEHVTLRASAPWVQDRGWLNFIGNWHYWAQPPGDHADWVSYIAPTSAGKLEVWLTNLNPGETYLVAIDVGCLVAGPNPAFKIGASDATGVKVNAQPPDQILLVLIDPAQDMSLVTVEPLDLGAWTFHSVEVFDLN